MAESRSISARQLHGASKRPAQTRSERPFLRNSLRSDILKRPLRVLPRAKMSPLAIFDCSSSNVSSRKSACFDRALSQSQRRSREHVCSSADSGNLGVRSDLIFEGVSAGLAALEQSSKRPNRSCARQDSPLEGVAFESHMHPRRRVRASANDAADAPGRSTPPTSRRGGELRLARVAGGGVVEERCKNPKLRGVSRGCVGQ